MFSGGSFNVDSNGVTGTSRGLDTNALQTYLTSNKYTRLTDIQGTYATKTELSTGLSDKVTNGQLSNYATLSTVADKVSTGVLGGYVTDQELNVFQTSLNNTYATKVEVDTKTSDKVTTNQLNNSLSNYATVASVADKVSSATLNNYATKTELADKVSTATLNNYATKTELADKVSTTTLNNYATIASVSDKVSSSTLNDYATKSDLSSKVDASVLTNYIQKTNFQRPMSEYPIYISGTTVDYIAGDHANKAVGIVSAITPEPTSNIISFGSNLTASTEVEFYNLSNTKILFSFASNISVKYEKPNHVYLAPKGRCLVKSLGYIFYPDMYSIEYNPIETVVITGDMQAP